MAEARGPYALAPGDGEAIWYRGTLMTVKAAKEQTGGALTVIEHAFPPGFASPLHVHHREEEPWYVLAGRVSFAAGDLQFEATPGAFIFLPRDVPHRFQVSSEGPAKMLLLSIPGGLEGMFRELGQAAVQREIPPGAEQLDLAKLRSVSHGYGVEILSQPPDSE